MKLAMRMMRCCTPRNHAWTPVSRAADFPGLRGQTLDFPDFPGLRGTFAVQNFEIQKCMATHLGLRVNRSTP
jgi:hypothetical protein